MRIITLMTDFGLRDGNVGVMKGVIWGINPEVQIVDISHLIGAQNVMEGALTLGRSAPYFPDGTIHVGVVDPGVGTSRRPIAARLGTQWFVGPDNGLCTVMLQHAEQAGLPVQIVHLDRPSYWLPQVSHVFHGRDIFSPVAAHLSKGLDLLAVGTPIADPVRLSLPEPERTNQGWRGQIIHIDHFGNIATNLQVKHLQDWQVNQVVLCGQIIPGMVRTFGERPPGELIALFGSTGQLVVSVVNGSAAQRLQAQIGQAVEVIGVPPAGK